MGKAIKLKSKDSWFDADYTGNDVNVSATKRMIKLLNSTMQDTYFVEGTEITKKDFGKYIITGNQQLTKDDILKEVTVTPLKMQRGHIVFEGQGADRNTITSVAYELRGEEKEKWLDEHPGQQYQNEVRLIATMYDADTTLKMIEDLRSGKTSESPLAFYYFNRSAYTALFDLSEKHQKAIADSEYSEHVENVNNVIKPVFKYTFKSEETESKQGRKFYVPTIDVGVNTPADVDKLEPIFLKLKDVCLFDEDPKTVKSEDGDSKLEVIDDADIDDLPF